MQENIDEFLETGKIQRLEAMKQDPMTQALVHLCTIHGVGPGTAQDWYNQGITSVEEAQRRFLGVHDKKTGLTEEQIMGLQYYEDLQHPLTQEDCEGIAKLVVTW
jgi:DNA polymerase/3'-5' exonuclease PolX